jgi:hypothetical protein
VTCLRVQCLLESLGRLIFHHAAGNAACLALPVLDKEGQCVLNEHHIEALCEGLHYDFHFATSLC